MKKRWTHFLIISMLILAGGAGWYEYYKIVVPEELTVRSGNREQFDLSIPALIYEENGKQWCSLLQPFSMTADQTGTYEMQ
ncbi:MAG: hypothetical protein IJ648_03065, partial [Lachnospiraceae bacterium]|nr:hypothetical protein [Lachnospiraceae bacterium]